MEVSSISQTSPEQIVKQNMYKEQYLFFLEFFVHSISGDRLEMLNKMFSVPTTVYLRFLSLEDDDVVEISPTDLEHLSLSDGNREKNRENFFSGRSVLFAVPHRLVIDKNTKFKIKIEVHKKMPEEIGPNVIVGSGELDLSEEFVTLRKEMFHNWHRDTPPPQCFEGPVQLYHQDELAIVAMIYARISGCGQSIVTEFESPSDQLKSSSFIFKSNEEDNKTIAYKCKVLSQSQMQECKQSLATNDHLIKSTLHHCSLCDQIVSNNNEITRNEPNNYNTVNNNSIVQSTNDNNTIIQSPRCTLDRPCGNPVVLKVSGILLDENGNVTKPTVTVGGESERSDDHDVFVLRIGKKGIVGEGEKSDIQVEMRTPKGPIKRPPIRYETREIQTDEYVQSDVTAKEKKKKGNKKKKKKKNKKK